MKLIACTAIGLAIFATPLAAGHLYSDGFPRYELQGHQVERQAPATGNPASPYAEQQRYGLTPGSRTARPGPRTGLDRPYGGQGVPYRTPPQGWPENPPF